MINITQIEELHEHLCKAREIFEDIKFDLEDEYEDIYFDLEELMSNVEEAESVVYDNFLVNE